MLQVGVRKAHQIAHQHDLKLVPVHHMEAHALVARAASDVQFPFLCMLVSGGHNMLLIAHGVGDYTLLGSTLDDSVGAECPPAIHAVYELLIRQQQSMTTSLTCWRLRMLPCLHGLLAFHDCESPGLLLTAGIGHVQST